MKSSVIVNKRFSVSIVVPCYNEEEHIGECIDSIKAQDFPMGDCEIIVADNGSTDRSAEIIIEKNGTLTFASKRGPAATKNAGLRIAKKDIIVFIDADCIADKKWLASMVKPFEDASVGCVAGEIVGFGRKSAIEDFLVQEEYLSQKVNVSHPFLPYAATANAAYRREVFERVGFFDESLFTGEDADMSWRMQLRTDYKLRYIPEAVAYHAHETSIKALFRQKQRHAHGAVALYKKYRKNWPRQQKSLKKTYWEYRSLAKRLMKFLKEYFINKEKHLDESHFRTILEAGWKFGLIAGSLRHGVWYV